MADKKISELTAITGANTAATDVFVVVDTSTGQTKKITREELNNAIEQDVLSSIDIDTINGDFTVNGNMAITGTVDGRDVATDGTKLDGIETGATADQTGSEIATALNGETLTGIASATVTGDLTVDTNTLYVDSTNNRVGFNANDTTTATSLANLVVGEYADTSSGIALRAGTASALNFEDTSGSTSARLYYNHTSDYMAINTNATERMRIDSSGNVGIGTTSPARELEVTGSGNVYLKVTAPTANDSAGIELANTGGTWLIQNDDTSNEALTFDRAGTEVMRIDSSGNVGIGTSSPASLVTGGSSPVLTIGGTDSGLVTGEKSGAISFITNDGSYTGTYSDGITGEIASVAESAVGGAYGLAFYTGTTTSSNRDERVRIGATGNVGIGTSSPDAPLVVEESAVSQTAQSNDISVFKRNGDGMIKVYTPNTNIGGIAFGDTDDPFIGALMYSHSDNSMQFYGNNSERMRIDNSGNVLIGRTTSTLGGGNGSNLQIGSGTTGAGLTIHSGTSSLGDIQFADGTTGADSYRGLLRYNHSANSMAFWTNSSERMRIDTSGNVGIGTTSPDSAVEISKSGGGSILSLNRSNTNTTGRVGAINFTASDGHSVSAIQAVGDGNNEGAHLAFYTTSAASSADPTTNERMRIDSSGNVTLGAGGTYRLDINAPTSSAAKITCDNTSMEIGTFDNYVVKFLQNNTERMRITTAGKVGIGVDPSYNLQMSVGSGSPSGANHFKFVSGSDGYGGGVQSKHYYGIVFIGTTGTSQTGLRFSTNELGPAKGTLGTGYINDNVMDLGASNNRWDDVRATNGTIQTSDQNLKQDIAVLTDAEITAAKAISRLFKTFKWIDKVEAKGDDARTHTGVIAQEVQQAMTGAGLDATKYAFWCSDTWWEAEATYEDENGDEHTGIADFKTIEEAPEGATEVTRLSIRYPELLAFIGAATEQRLADIETRLTALEN